MGLQAVFLYTILNFYCFITFGEGRRNVPPEIERNYWVPIHHECGNLEDCLPTITYKIGFDVQEDAMSIYGALKKNDLSYLINIMTRRTAVERSFISYFLIDLEKERTLKSRVISYKYMSQNLKEMVESLMMSHYCFQRSEFRKALQAGEYKHEALMDILGVLSNRGINKMLPPFNKNDNNKNLLGRLRAREAGLSQTAIEFFGRLDEKQEDDATPIEDEVNADAESLIEAVRANQEQTKLNLLMKIFLEKNIIHLHRVYNRFENAMKESLGANLAKSINSENDMYRIFYLYYKITKDRADYFAERLYDIFENHIGTKYGTNTLNKILIGRAEIDLMNIKEAFRKNYDETLETIIRKKLKGDYRDACLHLLRNPTENVEDEEKWKNYLNLYSYVHTTCEEDDKFESDIPEDTPSTSGTGTSKMKFKFRLPNFRSRNLP